MKPREQESRMGRHWADKVFDKLKKDELNYKFIFFDPKHSEFRLVKEKYILLPNRTEWLKCYDGKLFGVDFPMRTAKRWKFVGYL